MFRFSVFCPSGKDLLNIGSCIGSFLLQIDEKTKQSDVHFDDQINDAEKRAIDSQYPP